MDNFLSGREHVGETPKAKPQVQLASPEVLQALNAPTAEEAELQEECGEGGSKVQYLMDDGRVSKIVVTCACGQVTEIDCSYEGK